MNRRIFVAAAMMLATTARVHAQIATKPAANADAQPLAVLLEQGIYQEETAGNFDAAAKTYRQIADQAAVGRALVAQALSRLVALEVKQKQLDEARQTLERLKAEYPEQKDIIAKAAVLLPGNGQKAILAGDDQSERPQQNDHIPTAEEKATAAELAKQGWQQYRDGKNDTAADAFRRAIQLDPKSIDGLNGLGWTRLNERKQGADPYFAKVLELDPKNATALNGMGWTVLNGHNVPGSSSLAKMAERERSIPDAVKFWRQAIEIDPTATSPLSGLAQSAMETNQFNDAIKWYERWLSLEPKSAIASKGIERAKEGQKAVNEAMPIALEFLKSVDDDRLEGANKLLAGSGTIMVSDQGNRRYWSTYPSSSPNSVRAPTGFSTVAPEKWEEMMKQMRAPFGRAKNREIESVRGPNGLGPLAGDAPFGLAPLDGVQGRGNFRGLMILNFTTEFENDRRTTETMTLRKTNDGDWMIYGYGINMPATPRDPLKSQ